jgi:hypothetical protein
MSDVKGYFHDLFPRYTGEELDGIDFSEFPLSSICGVRCVEIMHRGNALLAICDEMTHRNILDEIARAIRIVCHG